MSVDVGVGVRVGVGVDAAPGRHTHPESSKSGWHTSVGLRQAPLHMRGPMKSQDPIAVGLATPLGVGVGGFVAGKKVSVGIGVQAPEPVWFSGPRSCGDCTPVCWNGTPPIGLNANIFPTDPPPHGGGGMMKFPPPQRIPYSSTYPQEELTRRNTGDPGGRRAGSPPRRYRWQPPRACRAHGRPWLRTTPGAAQSRTRPSVSADRPAEESRRKRRRPPPRLFRRRRSSAEAKKTFTAGAQRPSGPLQ